MLAICGVTAPGLSCRPHVRTFVSRAEHSSLEHVIIVCSTCRELSGVLPRDQFGTVFRQTCVSFCAWYQGLQSVVPGCLLESRMVRSCRDLSALKFASIWCSEGEFVRLRRVSKDWHRTFEHVPDEVVLRRIELQHAGYFARMVALQWVRKWTQCRPDCLRATSIVALKHAPMCMVVAFRVLSPCFSLVIERFLPHPHRIGVLLVDSISILVAGAGGYSAGLLVDNSFSGLEWIIFNMLLAVADRLVQHSTLAQDQAPVDNSLSGFTLLNKLWGCMFLSIAAVVLGEWQELPVLLKTLGSEHDLSVSVQLFCRHVHLVHKHLDAKANFRYQVLSAHQREQILDHFPRSPCHGDQDVVDLTNLWCQCGHLWRCSVWPGSASAFGSSHSVINLPRALYTLHGLHRPCS